MNLEQRNKKVEENLPLVTFCLNQLGIPYNEDYFQQGVLELIRCVNNYDASKGKKFSTYAVKNIKLFLKEYIIRDKVIKPKRIGYKGRVFAPPCDSFSKVMYNNGSDEEITLEDMIADNNLVESKLLMYDLELLVDRGYITNRELELFLDYYVEEEGKRYLSQKYKKPFKQLSLEIEEIRVKIKSYLSYNNYREEE